MKIGIDDFIKDKGAGEAVRKIESPAWTLDISVLSLEELEISSEDAVRSLFYKLVLLSKVEIEVLLPKVKAKSKISISLLREIIAGVNKEWMDFRPSSKNRPGTKTISIDDNIPRREILEDLSQLLCKDGQFFNYGEFLLKVEDSSKVIITPETLPAAFNDLHVEFVKGCGDKERFYTLPPNLAKIFCVSRSLRSSLKNINFFTDHPTYDSNWELVRPGYHEDEGIYYIGVEVVPERNIKLIPSIANDFLFEDDASRANYVAMLISALLRNKYRGDRPFGAMTGNRPSIGKTFACKAISIVAEGLSPQTMTFQGHEEDEKQIAARLMVRDMLQIDNVKSSRPIDSPALERLITDDPIAFRKLGYTETLSRPNTIITLITMNDAKFSKDLISRALPIRFFLDETIDPRSKKYLHEDFTDFVRKNRWAIVAEICGMIENWKDAGYPTCQKNFRFRQWAKEVGGILLVNGFDNFLDNYETASSDYDKMSHDLGALFESIQDKLVTAAELARAAEELDLFPEFRGAKKIPTALSHLLAKYVGKTLPLPNGSGYLTLESGKIDRTGTKTYIAKSSKECSAGTLKPIAGTSRDDGTDGPSNLSKSNHELKAIYAGTAGTESLPLETEGEKLCSLSERARPCAVSPNSDIVPAVPANPSNQPEQQGEDLHGQMQGPTNGIHGSNGASLRKKNNLNWESVGEQPN